MAGVTEVSQYPELGVGDAVLGPEDGLALDRAEHAAKALEQFGIRDDGGHVATLPSRIARSTNRDVSPERTVLVDAGHPKWLTGINEQRTLPMGSPSDWLGREQQGSRSRDRWTYRCPVSVGRPFGDCVQSCDARARLRPDRGGNSSWHD